MNRRRKETGKIKIIALERIEILLENADKVYKTDSTLAQNYAEKARKIAMKARVRIPRKWRFRFCNKCKMYLYPGISSRVRIKSGKPSRVTLHCNNCEQRTKSIPIKTKK
ncbi:MAG TPA: ribonuclease P [Candidatus Glassbacteria bacterium]|nr:ribonuclease P [Candidatus Glassbacteria bacterium]